MSKKDKIKPPKEKKKGGFLGLFGKSNSKVNTPMGQPPMGQPPMGQPMGQPPIGQQGYGGFQNPNQVQQVPPQMAPQMQRPNPMGMLQQAPPQMKPQRTSLFTPPAQQPQVPQQVPNQNPMGQVPQTSNPMGQVPQKPFYKDSSQTVQKANKKMDIKVFLYTEASIYDGCIEHYSRKPGISVVGTNVAHKLIEVYRQMPVENIIVVHSNNVSQTYVCEFLRFLVDVKKLNSNTVTIYSIYTKDIDIKSFNAEIGSYKDRINSYKFPHPIDNLDIGVLDQMIAPIINKQPEYLVDRPPLIVPKVASVKEHINVENLYQLKGIDGLSKMIKEAKLESNSQNSYKEFTKNIVYSNSPEDMRNITSLLPEVAALRKYEDLISSYIEEVKEGGGKFNLDELLLEKMNITSMEENLLRRIFTTVIDSGLKNLKNEKIHTEQNIEQLSLSLQQSSEDTKRLLEQREELKKAVTTYAEDYKKQVQLVVHAVQLRVQMYSEMGQNTAKMIADISQEGFEPSEEIQERAALLATDYLQKQDKLNAITDEVLKSYSNLIDYANKMFQNYNILIKADDILIDRLSYEIETLKANATRVITVESILKSKGKIHVLISKQMRPVISYLYDRSTLIITTVDTSLLELRENMRITSFEDYQTMDTSGTNKTNIIQITSDKNQQLKQLEELKNDLEFLANKYSSVVFIVDENTEQGYLRELKDLVIMSRISINDTSQELMLANDIKSILLENRDMDVTTLVNNVTNMRIEDINKLLGTTAKPTKVVTTSLEKAKDDDNLFINLLNSLTQTMN